MNFDTQNTVYFYAQTDAYSEFSNFAPYGVEFDDRWWRTVEHYFQAMKFHDEEYRERIRSCRRPKDAKALGITRKIPLRPDWEDVKDTFMLDAVRCRFKPTSIQKSFFYQPEKRALPKMLPWMLTGGLGQMVQASID